MENITISSHNKEQAQKVRRLMISIGCKGNSIYIPDDFSEGIKQGFSCQKGASDKLIDDIKEPGIIERNTPNKFKTSFTEHNVKKKRIIF